MTVTLLPSSLTLTANRLKMEEGLRRLPYKDSRGFWTFGYGHNMETTPVSEAACAFILMEDIENAENELIRTFPVYLKQSDVRKSVLIDMMFNMGPKALAEFETFLRYLSAEMYDLAAKDMLTSEWAKEIGHRAQVLSQMMATNQWV